MAHRRRWIGLTLPLCTLLVSAACGDGAPPALTGYWSEHLDYRVWSEVVAPIDERHAFVCLGVGEDVPTWQSFVIDLSDPSAPVATHVSVGLTQGAVFRHRGGRTIGYFDRAGIWDFTELSAPVQLATLGGQGVAVTGEWLYTGVNSTSILAVDVSNPAFPVEAGRVQTDVSVSTLAAHDHWLAASLGERVSVYRLDDPARPELVATLDLATTAVSFAFKGDHLLVGTAQGLMVYDLTAEGGPSQVTVYNAAKELYGSLWTEEDVAGIGPGMALSGDHLVIDGSQVGQVWMLIDVSDPAHPRLVWPSLGDEAPWCLLMNLQPLAVRDPLVYYYCDDDGLYVWHIGGDGGEDSSGPEGNDYTPPACGVGYGLAACDACIEASCTNQCTGCAEKPDCADYVECGTRRGCFGAADEGECLGRVDVTGVSCNDWTSLAYPESANLATCVAMQCSEACRR